MDTTLGLQAKCQAGWILLKSLWRDMLQESEDLARFLLRHLVTAAVVSVRAFAASSVSRPQTWLAAYPVRRAFANQRLISSLESNFR